MRSRRQNRRPTSRRVSRKLASGFLTSRRAPRARFAALQVAERAPSCAWFSYENASGCVVAPKKEHPDCAGLRGRYAIAEKVLKDNGASFAEGGRYADQIGLLDNISGTSGAAFVNTAAGVSLTYVGVRWAERAASLPAGNSIRNLGMVGLDFLATKAAILGIVYDVGNAVNSYANDRPLDAVQSGASGALTATALAIAQSNPYTAIAAGAGQVGIGAFEIGAQVYQNRVEEGRRLQSAQSSANLVSSAAGKVNAIANEMREKGCK